MPRPQKPLEDQLRAVQDELLKAEEKVSICKQKIENIKQQIEDRDMRQAYAFLKQNNISLKQLQSIVQKQNSKAKVN